MRRIWVAVAASVAWLVVGCGDDAATSGKQLSGAGGLGGDSASGTAGANAGAGGGPVGGAAGAAPSGGASGTGGGGATTLAHGCPDLFDPASLVEYAVEISADEWAKMDYEFRNVEALKAAGQEYKTYHPVVFHYGGETVADAMMRLKGDSSWRTTVMNDGDKAKMQFVISFEEVDTAAKFHGVSKLVLDMPNNDKTFMQERLGFTVLADMLALPAPCANNARLSINGQYYGLYTNEEHVGHSYIKRVFPEAPDGDLFEGGWTAKTNELAPNTTRQEAFWDAHDIGS